MRKEPPKFRNVGWKMPEELHQAVLRQANIENKPLSEILNVLVRKGLYVHTEEYKDDVG